MIGSNRSKEWEGLPSPDIWDAVNFALLEEAQFVIDVAGGERPQSLRQQVVKSLEEELEAALAGAPVAEAVAA